MSQGLTAKERRQLAALVADLEAILTPDLGSHVAKPVARILTQHRHPVMAAIKESLKA